MITGVHHIGLTISPVHDLSWLGHVCSQRNETWYAAPNVYVRIEKCAPDKVIETIKRPANIAGIAHICLQSRDINEGYHHGLTNGLISISEPVDLGTEFRYLYAHTSDGVLLELEGAPFVADVEPHFWLGHVAFVAQDIELLVNFYSRALRLDPTPTMRLRGNKMFDKVTGFNDVDLSAKWLPGLNLGLEYWHYHNPETPQNSSHSPYGFNHVCFESEDFETDCAHLLAQGGAPIAMDDLGLEDCSVAGFLDPEGNKIVIIAFNDGHHPLSIKKLAHSDILARVTAQRSR